MNIITQENCFTLSERLPFYYIVYFLIIKEISPGINFPLPTVDSILVGSNGFSHSICSIVNIVSRSEKVGLLL